MLKTTRRGFMVGCSSAIAAMAGARLNYAAFANPESEPHQNILVVVFLRGGCDALSLVAPYGGEDRAHYAAARPELRIAEEDLLQLDSSAFGLHPAATGLHQLYNSGRLAVVQGTGMHSDTRSHFDAMAYMEQGTPDNKGNTTGWLTRHLQSAENLEPNPLMPSLSAGTLQPTSLLGQYDNITMSRVDNFNLNTGPWNWREAQKATLSDIYNSGSSAVHQAGAQAITAVDVISSASTSYTPLGNPYPNNGFGEQLQIIAQMIKLQLGLSVATVDLGGWDTHDNQIWYGDPAGGYFGDLVTTLSQGLNAFYTDLEASPGSYAERITVVVLSEFGRRLRENAERGTDHGHGSMMMVMGGQVNGGLHGQWPGLHNEQLYDGADLEVTTDYRRVLSEILIRRFANPNLGIVFPGYQDYAPLGLVQGADLEPNYESGGAVYDHRTYLPTVIRGS